jgi:hypothetical protein
MRRAQVEDVLRRLAPLVGRPEVTLIGSQCVHAITDDVPAEVLMSREIDILFDAEDAVVDAVDRELGEDSPFHAEFGVYVDPITGAFPFLPEGWERRTRAIDVGVLRARCLEIHDLALSKLAAGRLKDNEMVAALIANEIADLDTIRERIAVVADLHLRAILMARLQLVLENVGR